MARLASRSVAFGLAAIAITLLFAFAVRVYLSPETRTTDPQTVSQMLGDKHQQLPIFLSQIGANQIRVGETLDFQIKSPAATPTAYDSVYFPFAEGNMVFSYRGAVFYDSQSRGDLYNATTNSTILATLPEGFVAGDLIDISASRAETLIVRLSKAHFGNRQDFQAELDRQGFYYSTLRVVGISFCILTILFVIILLASGKSPPHYYGLLVMTVWTLLMQITVAIPKTYSDTTLPWQLTFAFSPAAICCGMIFIQGMMQFSINMKARKLLVVAIVYYVFVLLNAALGISDTRLMNLVLTSPFVSMITIVGGFKMLSHFAKYRNELAVLIFGFSLVFLGLSVTHDVSGRLGLINGNIFLSRPATLLLFISLTALLVDQMSKVSAERLRISKRLEEEVAQKSAELQMEFNSRLTSERNEAISSEKLRLHDELHDGVLSYLSTIHAIADKPEANDSDKIRGIAKNAINEIRFMLDTDEAETHGALLRTLASLSKHSVTPLQKLGIEVTWDILELAQYKCRSSGDNIHVYRILQEVVRNAVDGANCRHLAFEGKYFSDTSCQVKITNTGGDTFTEGREGGRGLSTMKRRAEQLGGRVEIVAVEGGASFTLYLPPQV